MTLLLRLSGWGGLLSRYGGEASIFPVVSRKVPSPRRKALLPCDGEMRKMVDCILNPMTSVSVGDFEGGCRLFVNSRLI